MKHSKFLTHSVQSDESEILYRGIGSSTNGIHRGVTDKCDHEDGLFKKRTAICYCDEDLCNGSATAAASAVTILAAIAVIVNTL